MSRPLMPAEDGTAGLELACTGEFDLVLLDVMLPGINGLDICERVRARHPDQAIIMLTARGEDDDRIQGLTLGADDYVTKPFSIAELVLRVEAVLRRTRPTYTDMAVIQLATDVRVDTQNLSAEVRGDVVRFTRREVEVVQYLHTHRERPVGRDELLSEVWGYKQSLDIETRTVDIHIAKLRRKLEANPQAPRLLTTVRGAGYRLCPDPAD
ncbi:MAG: response regulator transcription factor [Pseudomonadota bacterium]